MEEPTHANEDQFWDRVTDWLLGDHDDHDYRGSACPPLSSSEGKPAPRNPAPGAP